MAREVGNSDEDLRQEGREEVLEWFLARGFVNYSSIDKQFFMWNRFTELLTILPWTKSDKSGL